MNTTDIRFLDALKASLKDEQVQWQEAMEEQEWNTLFEMAEKHHVLPMIFEAVFSCPAAQMQPPALFGIYKAKVIQSVVMQERRTTEFLQMLRYLQAADLQPLVVKGLICRELYPKPDYRYSGDEDILIPPEMYAKYHEMMSSYGMFLLDPEQNPEKEYEVPYGKKGTALYIELHKYLFAPESDAYGDLNHFFEHAAERRIAEIIQDTMVYTMEYTDHLFYLICHAFKHFLHSGFGIRQICDIVLFANTYGSEVDWKELLVRCREIHAERFAAALFRIGKKYLTFSAESSCYPDIWRKIQADETDLLEDLLCGGVYGRADMERIHSSTITLNAVADQKKGKHTNSWKSVMKSAFPSAGYLENRYPWLKKYPFLLPAAWVDRIWKYRKETQKEEGNSAANSIRIGNDRVELLRKYGIIK